MAFWDVPSPAPPAPANQLLTGRPPQAVWETAVGEAAEAGKAEALDPDTSEALVASLRGCCEAFAVLLRVVSFQDRRTSVGGMVLLRYCCGTF